MAVQFQLHIPDPEDVPRLGAPLLTGFDFKGMTAEQAKTAITVFEKTIARLRKVIEFEEEHHEEVRDRGGAPRAEGVRGVRRGPGDDRGPGRPAVFRVMP